MSARSPERFLAPIRRSVMAAALLGGGYLVWRYDVFTLPGECSPVLALQPGVRLIVDTRPRAPAPNDLVLHGGPEEALHLGRVVAATPEGLRIIADNPNCSSAERDDRGPVPPADVAARVIFVLPGW